MDLDNPRNSVHTFSVAFLLFLTSFQTVKYQIYFKRATEFFTFLQFSKSEPSTYAPLQAHFSGWTNYKPNVFVPNFDLELIRTKNPKAKLTGIKEPIQINDYLWSTGQMKGTTFDGDIYEQSLMIIQDGSIYLLTGCSHPGIVEIVEKTKKVHPNKILKLIIGGFHLYQHSAQQIKDISSKLKGLQVSKLAPSHCTGEQAINIFKDEWKENYIDFNIGNSMKI